MDPDRADRYPYGLTAEATSTYLRLAAGEAVEMTAALQRELVIAGVIEQDWSSGRWVPATSSLAMSRLAHNLIRQAKSLMENAAHTVAQLEQLPSLYGYLSNVHEADVMSVRGDRIRHFDDNADVRTIVGRYLSTSSDTIRSAQPKPRPEQALRASLVQDLPAARRVKMMTILPESARTDPVHCEWARAFTEVGADIRTTSIDIDRVFIFDATAALLARPEGPGAILITDTLTVAAITRLFDHIHSAGRRFTGQDDEGPVLTERQHAILKHALAGDQSKQIATALGVSPSTVEKEVASIRTAFGVTTNVALGAAYALWQAGQHPR